MNYGFEGFGTQGIIWIAENWSLITMPHPSVIATKGAIWSVTICPSITILQILFPFLPPIKVQIQVQIWTSCLDSQNSQFRINEHSISNTKIYIYLAKLKKIEKQVNTHYTPQLFYLPRSKDICNKQLALRIDTVFPHIVSAETILF